MQPPEQRASSLRPTLTTLPSELRKLIVSYLAPASVDEIKPGCKQHLQNANLTHSCLREWATEYLFRDIELTHVLLGASCNLEIFAITPQNAHLLKHVKHIIVQVSPAIRWEVGLANPFQFNLEEVTRQRLCRKFNVSDHSEMSASQQQYCADYHEAMVEPFTENRRWYQLLRSANNSFARIFSHFPNLASISVASRERVDQPRPTNTSTFVLQYGKTAVEDVHPRFVEDATVNMGWASAIILRSAPCRVANLHLSLANMDNFNSVAAVNRLLSLSYRHKPVSDSAADNNTGNITRLSLSFRGVAGTHGHRNWHGDTGSAGGVRFWTRQINRMQYLQHLSLSDCLSESADTRFSGLENSEPKASVLTWLLPLLVLNQLTTLRLAGFVLPKRDLQDALDGPWPKLQRLVLHKVQLLAATLKDDDALRDHRDGATWLAFCRHMALKQPGVAIHLVQPSSTCAALHPACVQAHYVDKLVHLRGLTLIP